MCAGGVVCKGEMDIVIIVHTGNNGKSGCTTNRVCENISKVISFLHFSPSIQGQLAKRKSGDSIHSVEETEKYLDITLENFWCSI